jgi:hypothetical protein
MSLAWRVTATAVALAGLVAVGVYKFVLLAMYWRIEPASTGTWVNIGTVVVAMFGPLLVYLWLTRRLLRAPATFHRGRDEVAFVVSGSPAQPGFLAITLMVQAANTLPMERVPGTDRIGLPVDPGLQALMAVPALMVIAAFALLWLPGPELRLTPAGITMRNAFRTHHIRWDDLLPGGPHPGQWTIRLLHSGPDGKTGSNRITVFRLHINAVFLATVLRHYAERPEHRAEIGTQAERDRLETGFQQWKAQPVTRRSTPVQPPVIRA